MTAKTTTAALAAAGAMMTGVMLCFADAASASYVGLFLNHHATVSIGGEPYDVYRVYAEFTQPIDRVNVWGAGGNLGPGLIENIRADGSPGSGFYNDDTQPPPNPNWDTYATIGLAIGEDQGPGGISALAALPGTPAFIIGTQWAPSTFGGGYYITPDDAQGMAGYIVNGPDTELRVLLMQLTVNAEEHVRGTIGISWSIHGQTGTGGMVTGQTFNSIPSPSALALLAAAGLFGLHPRRRRPARGVTGGAGGAAEAAENLGSSRDQRR